MENSQVTFLKHSGCVSDPKYVTVIYKITDMCSTSITDYVQSFSNTNRYHHQDLHSRMSNTVSIMYDLLPYFLFKIGVNIFKRIQL